MPKYQWIKKFYCRWKKRPGEFEIWVKGSDEKVDGKFYEKVDEIVKRLDKKNKYGDFQCVDFKKDFVKALKKAKYSGQTIEINSKIDVKKITTYDINSKTIGFINKQKPK